MMLRQIVAGQSVMLTEFQAPSFKLQGATIWRILKKFLKCYYSIMFNLNKFDTQKEIWEEPSLVDEVEDTKNYYGMFPKFWYNKPSEKTMEELEKMFREN